jgi:hypothetical protein
MNILERWDKQPREYHFTISILFALVIGFLDYWMGFEYRMKIFYLMPISYATWFIGKKTGIVFSTWPAITMLYSVVVSGKNYGNASIEIWDIAMYLAFFIIVTLLLSKLRITMQQRAGLITKLQNALDAVKELSGILPICANCKKIRDDEGYWHDVDVYISRHTKAEFTHGICKECANKLYPSLFDKIEKGVYRGVK